MSRTANLPGLASAPTVIRRAFARAARPIRARTVAQWADDERWVGPESGSPQPGRWSNATTPFGVEIMACLDADHPCRRVILAMAAQLIKTEIGLNWIGSTICDDPASMMIVLPSLDELRNWNGTKFQPTVDATPALRTRVFGVVERSGSGSTTSFKRFRGGFLIATTASSSKGLQARSIKRLVCDEVSEFPADAGGRGDPIKQAETRGDAHYDFKALHSSTPKLLPGCRITGMFNAGDQRRYYVPCPHCGHYQHLTFERLLAPTTSSPRVAYACAAHGCVIDEIAKPAMLAAGRWIKTYPDVPDPQKRPGPDNLANPDNPTPPDHQAETQGDARYDFPPEDLARWLARSGAARDPSFHLWQAYSPFKSWTLLWREYQEATRQAKSGEDRDALKVFTQQKLGRPWDPATEAPDHDKLHAAAQRNAWGVRRGQVPAWACQIIGVADVQGDRVEWDAYAIGPDLSMARFDWGVVEHDPLEAEAWAELGQVVGRRFEGASTIPLGFDIFGIDLRGKKGVTEKVYRFVRGRHNVVALAGAKDPDAVPLERRKRRVIHLKDGGSLTVQPHLVGTHGLKTVVYSMLATTLLDGAEKSRLAGGLYNPPDATLEDFKQYCSEVFKQPKTMRAAARGWWERLPGVANERLDLAVYAYALAWYLGAFVRTAAEWQVLMQARAARPLIERDLFNAATLPAQVPAAETAENPQPGEVEWTL